MENIKNSELSPTLPFEIIETMLQFFNTGKIPKLGESAFVYEGFCLYSAIVALELKEDDFIFFNEKERYNDVERYEDIKKNLKATKKFKNKEVSDEEFIEIISKNNLTDIRNSFAHGNFELSESEGKKFFVLAPPRPANITIMAIKINFEDLYPVIGEKFQNLQEEMKKNEKTRATGEYFFKILALAYTEMAYFFSGRVLKNFTTKDWIIKLKGFILQHLISIHTSYSQNSLYPYLKAHPALKKRLCIYRNSTIHSNTVMEKAKFKFVDIDERHDSKEELTSSLKDFNKDLAGILTVSMIEMTKEMERDFEIIVAERSDISGEEIEKYRAKLSTLQGLLADMNEKYNPEKSEEDKDDAVKHEWT